MIRCWGRRSRCRTGGYPCHHAVIIIIIIVTVAQSPSSSGGIVINIISRTGGYPCHHAVIIIVIIVMLRNDFRRECDYAKTLGQKDSIHQLERAAQVTIFRLTTGHFQLLSHLHRLKVSHSDEWPCGTGPQPPSHILQSCPTFNTLRHQTWPSLVDVHRKLWGPVETLRQTADFALLTEDLAWPGTQKKKKNYRHCRQSSASSGSIAINIISQYENKIVVVIFIVIQTLLSSPHHHHRDNRYFCRCHCHQYGQSKNPNHLEYYHHQ